MKKERIYKAHLLFTKEPGRFEVIENGYVAVSADGRVTGVAADLASVQRSTLNAQRLDSEEAEVTDFRRPPADSSHERPVRTCSAISQSGHRHGLGTVAVAPAVHLPQAFWLATKSAGCFFGQVGSFEPGYEFDALVIGDSDLNHDNYSLLQRLERYIYLGDDRQIEHRFCRGKAI